MLGAVFTGWAVLFLLCVDWDDYKTIPIEKTNCKRKAGTMHNFNNQGRIRGWVFQQEENPAGSQRVCISVSFKDSEQKTQ